MTNRRIRQRCIMVIWGVILNFSFLHAQSQEELFALQQQKLSYIYAQEHGGLGLLIHGKLYEDYLPTAKGDPFWGSSDWTIGKLQTNHIFYQKLPLKYDAYLDELVFAANLMEQNFIKVNKDLVKSFWIQEKQFDFLGRGGEKAAMELVNLVPGYFELLYEGKFKLYAKRQKRLEKYERDFDHIGEFYEKNVYFLRKNQVFWIIDDKKELLQFAKEHEEEMEKYIKLKGIRYRSISDDQLIQLITYYESL